MNWALVLAILFGLGPRVGLPVRSERRMKWIQILPDTELTYSRVG